MNENILILKTEVVKITLKSKAMTKTNTEINKTPTGKEKTDKSEIKATE